MTITRILFAGALALALAACTHDVTVDDGKISVVDWATEMAQAERPDTIQDKFDIVRDTDDPRAFDGVIELARQQSAAEAAAQAADEAAGGQ